MLNDAAALAMLGIATGGAAAGERAPLVAPGEVGAVALESIPGGTRLTWDETGGVTRVSYISNNQSHFTQVTE